MIPILVEAIKEQDEAILDLDKKLEDQAAQIELLLQEIALLKNPGSSK